MNNKQAYKFFYSYYISLANLYYFSVL